MQKYIRHIYPNGPEGRGCSWYVVNWPDETHGKQKSETVTFYSNLIKSSFPLLNFYCFSLILWDFKILKANALHEHAVYSICIINFRENYAIIEITIEISICLSGLKEPLKIGKYFYVKRS